MDVGPCPVHMTMWAILNSVKNPLFSSVLVTYLLSLTDQQATDWTKEVVTPFFFELIDDRANILRRFGASRGQLTSHLHSLKFVQSRLSLFLLCLRVGVARTADASANFAASWVISTCN
jgi:hypothetical protein